MAEALIVSVAERLGSLLSEQVSFLCDVKEQVVDLQVELNELKSFLKDVDAKQEGNEVVRTYISEIRELAYDVEDVIDDYMYNVANGISSERNLVSGYSCLLCRIPETYHVGKEIEAIQKRIQKITTKLVNHGVRRIAGADALNFRQQQVRETFPYVNDELVIGLEQDVNHLVEQLTGKDNCHNAVCITGMGGSGKTTLARQIYNHPPVKEHFEYRAWISISQQWDVDHLLLEILRQTCGLLTSSERWSRKKLMAELRIVLEQRLFLVVLDDVWDIEVLERILPALPCLNNTSKLVITTRKGELLQLPDLSYIMHEPRHLTEHEGWKLFKKIALCHRRTSQTSSNFETLGKKMLNKCDGLPLAIVALAGILKMKDTFEQWLAVDRAFSARLMEGRGTNQYGKVEEMLALSFHDLPYYLKPCFLYLGVFPEDHEIKRGNLVRMWIAEGFISYQQLNGQETLEDVAEQHLDELSQRCVIQVANRSLRGRIRTFRLHDLIRDLCLKKAGEQNFLVVASTESATAGSFQWTTGAEGVTKPRRVSFHHQLQYNSSSFIARKKKNSRLRTFISFGHCPISDLRVVCENFMLLRVIQIDSDVQYLPAQIGKLMFLRYLKIKNIGFMPPSVGNLHNLLTLDFSDDENLHFVLPNVIWKLEQLRHLYLPIKTYCDEQVELHTLKHLQTLWGISANTWKLEDLASLSNLQKLRITDILSKTQLDLITGCPSFRLGRLCRLHLQWGSGFELPSMGPFSQCNSLSRLHLDGKLGQMLSGQVPWNLTELFLGGSELTQDPMQVLGNLPNLKRLTLNDAYNGDALSCNEYSFPQLIELRLQFLYFVVEWQVETGSLPQLKILTITSCKRMRSLPEGLKHITTIHKLEIVNMPVKFSRRVLPKPDEGLGGEDYEITQHIPEVQVF
ncbi:hypothetical protein Ancab_029042 [Ancistrocladus abbreviatus]